MHDAVKALPERRCLDAGARNDGVDDEIVEDFGDLQTANGNTLNFSHRNASTEMIDKKCATSETIRPADRRMTDRREPSAGGGLSMDELARGCKHRPRPADDAMRLNRMVQRSRSDPAALPHVH
jgi:hypothetical protein